MQFRQLTGEMGSTAAPAVVRRALALNPMACVHEAAEHPFVSILGTDPFPWLIQKFIDPQAEFIFVPADQVATKARELGATPFDIDGCELGHHGEDVSFNLFLKKYKLTDPALTLLGEIVRAADSHPSKPHPAGEGLRWVAFGFSALGLSDAEILQREFIVYDALYAECRRRAAGAGGV